jgi:hypothetical protein
VLGGTKKVADVSVDVVVSDVPLLGVERIELLRAWPSRGSQRSTTSSIP